MMNQETILTRGSRLQRYGALLLALLFSMGAAATTQAAEPTQKAPAKAAVKKKAPAKPAEMLSVSAPTSTIEFAPQVTAAVGKSTLLKLPAPATRVSVGNTAVADVILLNPREVYLLGKSVGSTNIMLWSKTGQTTVVDVTVVGVDIVASLQGKLKQLLPGETGIKISAAADSVVLTGIVSDAVKVDQAVALAEAYLGTEANKDRKVINMLQAAAPQQVMLEVKVAEVSKTLLDKLGAQFNSISSVGGGGKWTYKILSDFLTDSSGVLGAVKGSTRNLLIDAEKKDGLVKILAEPTIMAMSGQEGAFLAGGRFYIPVPQSGGFGGVGGITLEEKEFGVGLRFTPTVLEGGRINLRVTPEVSELSTTGTTISSSGTISVLPTVTTRRASTTVQLHDGQSFVIGGLIKNNVTETIKAFPILGEIPILGALFRSSEFQSEKSELVFVVTPRLVKPIPPDYKLPTDGFIEPSRSEFFLEGRLEAKPAEAPKPADAAQPKPQSGNPSGFEMK